MKKILLLLAVVIFSQCSSVKETQENISKGNYDKAIAITLKKIRKNRNFKKNKDYIYLLKEAFNKAVERDYTRLSFLKKDKNPANFENIYKLYLSLNQRQEMIKPILPLRNNKTGEEVVFDIQNYEDEIITSKNSFVSYLYDTTKQLMQSNNKQDYKKAFDNFQYINKLYPNYKSTHVLMDEAFNKGVDYVLVSVINNTKKVIPKRLEDDLLDLKAYKLNDFWSRYHNQEERGVVYDYLLEVRLNKIDISPERQIEKQFIKEKQIKNGYKYATDNDGTILKDSLGNKIKIDKYKTIRCEVNEFTQNKSCHMTAQADYIDLRSNQIVESFPLNSEFVFEHVYANYEGNRNALESKFLDLLKRKRVHFPSNEQMIYDTGQDLKRKLIKIVKDNKI